VGELAFPERTTTGVGVNPFRRRDDKFEAIGFASVAVVALMLALALGWWLFLGLAAVAAFRSALHIRSLRAARAAAGAQGSP
jgi:hypothetical protein